MRAPITSTPTALSAISQTLPFRTLRSLIGPILPTLAACRDFASEPRNYMRRRITP